MEEGIGIGIGVGIGVPGIGCVRIWKVRVRERYGLGLGGSQMPIGNNVPSHKVGCGHGGVPGGEGGERVCSGAAGGTLMGLLHTGTCREEKRMVMVPIPGFRDS